MNERNFKVIVVTNQSGFARGKFDLEQVLELQDWVNKDLAENGAHINE